LLLKQKQVLFPVPPLLLKKWQSDFSLAGLKPGVHAIHIHEKSDCSAADGSSAGGHWNPTFKKHGKWGVGEYHKGDIGNFADANGNGTITLLQMNGTLVLEIQQKIF
jgi:Cu/Zn superoxide dismutase